MNFEFEEAAGSAEAEENQTGEALWDEYLDSIAHAGAQAEQQRQSAEQKEDAAPRKELTAEEWKRREEKVFCDPKVKEFMEQYGKILESGKMDEQFLKSARELGKQCLADYDTFYFLWHKLNRKGISLSVNEEGISFGRTTYLGGTDGIGHPAIPYGSVNLTLTIPLDGSAPTASEQTMLWGRSFFRDREDAKKVDKDEAAQRIFKPKPSSRTPLEHPVRLQKE